MDHSIYDKRGYPIVDVREGYGAWVRTCEQTIQEPGAADQLLDGLATPVARSAEEGA